ncbi:hypothetical protein ABZ464_23135 [Streptomyces sp. NPDC005820]|uniref:hypothetical protein n=1 Tax=Streptomyces sp. NPDC005820 TaxID=3157069 RepID=UPI003401AE4B
MAKRTGAVALAAGALLALSAPVAVADEGRVEWTLAVPGVSLDVTAPAVPAVDGGASFPVLEGGTDAVELGGAVRLSGPAEQPLVLAGLRLRLTGDEGELYARTVVDGRARELALADVAGVRASLTAEGAELLSSWSGTVFREGDGLGELGVDAPEPVAESPRPSPTPTASVEPKPEPEPAASVGRSTVARGTPQTVTATGLPPGAVVLVAIDGDTRYQDTVDAEGRIARSFPVYDTAVVGEHTVELTQVGAEQPVVALGFTVH